MAYLWETRLDGKHDLTPELTSNVMVPSDTDELQKRMREIFARHVRGLIESGKELNRWVDEINRLSKEITNINTLLKSPNQLRVINIQLKKKVLEDEKRLVEKRVSEFRCAMGCFLKVLEDNKEEKGDYDYCDVFRFDGRLLFDWKRVHSLIMRECRRLEEGLPIYAYRRDILREILHQQIMVLVGETGYGKSTQLVQFLADSGIGANEAIICTQPRKIAAKSLAQRVHDESSGCYEGKAVNSYAIYSSLHEFDSRITFMTDHCLLQHYMSDNNLTGVSCIIIDEAHERSLNTDLLLALIKNLLCRRVEMRLIIMSATADAEQLSDYFYGCGIFHVVGRSFPVDVLYVPSDDYTGYSGAAIASYVSDVVRMATQIHKTEKEGAVLAFLTSQVEVESACEHFEAPSAVALPLHGKLSSEEQFHVFQNYPGKRKVIFATNLAETSLTIPGVKYVIDCGLVKDSCFDPGSGMNVLNVSWISQSSANQRAGRAGRTEPGWCYRLYSKADYQLMELNQEPEIRRVHLGVAVLRILALGVKNVKGFDFIDAPSPSSIEMAIQNLIQLGVVKLNNHVFELTHDGRCLVRMGVEPRLGKLIIGCAQHAMGREGIVLAAVMANASSIFCRVGNECNKQKSDCLKVQFCHRDGDLFTLLSVYKEWEALPRERKNQWCWENSINAKSMRRCQDTILELESCLERELKIVVPSYWRWNPLEKKTSVSICAVHKFTSMANDAEDREKWGRITFLSPDAAERAAELNGVEFCGSSLKICPSQTAAGDKSFLFPAVKAKICWPRRLSKGFAVLRCDLKDVNWILRDFYNLAIGGRYVRCEPGRKEADSVVISGIDKELSEAEILDVLRSATSKRILDFFLIRGEAVGNPTTSACEEALLKEISPFMPKRNPHISSCRVQVFQPEPKDAFMRALLTFDGRLHLEAAKALDQIDGNVLPGCLSWKKIKCQHVFHSSLTFPMPVYRVIKEELEKVLEGFRNIKGLEWNQDKTANGSHRVKITANATKTVAEFRRPLEELSSGKIIQHEGLTPTVLQLMLSREGFHLKNSLQQETGTYILFDRHNLNLRVFGLPDKVALAQQKVIQSLPDLMKQVVKNFGPDLCRLKEKVPGADPILIIRRQIIFLRGDNELKPKVEESIFEIVFNSSYCQETWCWS